MKKIAEIVGQIRDELDGAKEYAMCAMHYKATDKPLADTYINLANVELGHVDLLHAQVTRLIDEQKKSGASAPEGMMAVWNWEHKQQIAKVAAVKSLIETAKKP